MNQSPCTTLSLARMGIVLLIFAFLTSRFQAGCHRYTHTHAPPFPTNPHWDCAILSEGNKLQQIYLPT